MSVFAFAGAAQFAAVGYVAQGLPWLPDRHPDVLPQRPPPAVQRVARPAAARRPLPPPGGDGPRPHRRGVRARRDALPPPRARGRAGLLDRRRGGGVHPLEPCDDCRVPAGQRDPGSVGLRPRRRVPCGHGGPRGRTHDGASRDRRRGRGRRDRGGALPLLGPSVGIVAGGLLGPLVGMVVPAREVGTAVHPESPVPLEPSHMDDAFAELDEASHVHPVPPMPFGEFDLDEALEEAAEDAHLGRAGHRRDERPRPSRAADGCRHVPVARDADARPGDRAAAGSGAALPAARRSGGARVHRRLGDARAGRQRPAATRS